MKLDRPGVENPVWEYTRRGRRLASHVISDSRDQERKWNNRPISVGDAFRFRLSVRHAEGLAPT